jgi:hypothetical protein
MKVTAAGDAETQERQPVAISCQHHLSCKIVRDTVLRRMHTRLVHEAAILSVM